MGAWESGSLGDWEPGRLGIREPRAWESGSLEPGTGTKAPNARILARRDSGRVLAHGLLNILFGMTDEARACIMTSSGSISTFMRLPLYVVKKA